MSSTTEIIGALDNHINAAFVALEEKGVEIPADSTLADMAAKIEEITPPTVDWAEITYYSGSDITFSTSWASGCTVDSVDAKKYLEFLSTVESMGMDDFSYNGSTWTFAWETTIGTTADLLTRTGIAVTLTSQSRAEFSLTKSATIDTSAPLITADLTQQEFASLYNPSTNNPNPVYVGDSVISHKGIKSCTLGKQVTSLSNGFLAGCSNMTDFSFGDAPLTTIGKNCFYAANALTSLSPLPASLTDIGVRFLYSCLTFNQDIALPSGLQHLGADFMMDCRQMTSTIDVGSLSANIADSKHPESGQNSAIFGVNWNQTTAPAFATGMGIKGSSASAWRDRFPDKLSASSAAEFLRKTRIVTS